jgi:uncharacterized protein (TIGR00251 family)
MAENSTRVRVRVSASARRSEFVGRHGDAWKVRVAAPPEDGRANEAGLQLLATTLELPRADVSLVGGHSGRAKVVALAGLDDSEATRRLRRAGGS